MEPRQRVDPAGLTGWEGGAGSFDDARHDRCKRLRVAADWPLHHSLSQGIVWNLYRRCEFFQRPAGPALAHHTVHVVDAFAVRVGSMVLPLVGVTPRLGR